MNKKVVGIGEILWDVFPEGKVLGGAPANFAYHATQLGLEGYAISAVGKDDLGDQIWEALKGKPLQCMLEETAFPTGTVKVTLNGNGIPEYEICENVAWDNIPLTHEMKELAQQADAVCFGSLAQRHPVSRASIQAFVGLVSSNALKVFDINLRQSFYNQAIIVDSLKMANVLKINEEELVRVAELLEIKVAEEGLICQTLMGDYDLNIVVLTRGENGSFVFSKNETSFLETPKVEVADTVGAGDSFTGAFVAGLLNGNDIAQAHKRAVEVSAYVCTQKGAMPVLPSALLK
ncbi:carbohydrate kinase family protein [Geofilum rubicundum]|uniref:Fructokinase n=1 Tax=Geofilum rubicundum JCM 15548 TaxID=1236989 RepID=A0A0E9LSD1_9BACT|nr:carbohydrate kinase [Geofilum rubicundum]GAO28477.1 fructokinase [Geofilum rubicundum JCM 15548]